MRKAVRYLSLQRWCLAWLILSLYGCPKYVTKEEFETYKQAQQDEAARNSAEHHALRGQQERDRTQIKAEIRQVASRAACDNEKLREFLRECEEGSDQCSEKGINNAWKFITTQQGVELFMRPHGGAKIVATRRGQLMSTCDPKTWLPSTRFLILVKPRGESAEHHEEAMRVGREVRTYLVDDLFDKRKDVRILGPKTLPCKMKTEELANYSGIPLPYPLRGEPQGRDSAVIVWVFRTDC